MWFWHLFHGTVPGMQPGQTLGHEFMGIAEEVGPEAEESPLRLLKDILHNRIMQKKQEDMHRTHNRDDTDRVWTEIH